MPKKNETNETSTPSLDDLLEIGKENSAEVEKITPTLENAPESFESTELAALKAELAKAKEDLAKALTSPTEGRPVPESELTPDQRQIRILQDELARTKGVSAGTLEYEDVAEGEGVLIHILEDGFNASYRGQEILFGPQSYEETKDRFGVSWLNLTDEEQFARWGNVKFRKGPWPGKRQYEEPGLENKSIRTLAPIVKI